LKEGSHALVRTIGRWSLVALMVNSILGAGIFGLPSLLASKLAGYAPIASLLAGAGMLVMAGCIAEVASRFEKTGGLYLYARFALGRFAGLLVGWLIWLTRIAAPAAAADLFATYAGQFFACLHGRSAEIVVEAVLLAHLAVINYLGVKMGKTVSNVFTAIKVGILGAFILSGLFALISHPELRVALSFVSVPVKNWFEALLLLVFAYGGFEGALIVGGESSNPKKDMPFALLTALVLQCFIYTGVIYVVVSTLPNAGMFERSLASAAQRFLGGWAATGVGIAALVSTYGYLSANLLHSPRIAFALAEQGDFPRVLARIHPRFRTPHFSIVLYAVTLFAFAAMGSFQWNATLSAVTRLVVYGAMAIALPVLRKRDGPAPFANRTGLICSVATLVIALVLLSQMGRGETIAVTATTIVALVNWMAVRGQSQNQIGG
jgi:basic amino acid/polyamine antiporter, APA family